MLKGCSRIPYLLVGTISVLILKERVDPVLSCITKSGFESLDSEDFSTQVTASHDDAERAINACATAWSKEYAKAIETVRKDRKALLAF